MRRTTIIAWVVALALLSPAQALPQTVTNENGYEVRRSRTVVPAPYPKAGYKKVDRETRKGNTRETNGNSVDIVLTNGGFLDRCAVPDGGSPPRLVVRGDVEISVVVDTVDADVVPTARRRDEKRVSGRVKIYVSDDFRFTDGELDGEFSSNLNGVSVGPTRFTARFKIGQFAEPDWAAVRDVANVTRDRLSAALLFEVSKIVMGVQFNWGKPYLCANSKSDPPSSPGAGVPIEALPSAGITRGKRETAVELNLLIEHRLADRRGTPKHRGGFMIFSGDVRFEARLLPQRRLDPQPVDVLYAEVRTERTYLISHLRCSGSGKEVEFWVLEASLKPDTQTFELTIDGGSPSPREFDIGCVDGAVDIFSDLGQHGPFQIPTKPGSRQQFVIPNADEVDEILTVTVK